MKLNIKKLRTCAHSKALVSSDFLGQDSAHSNKRICDHPAKKVHWTLAACAECEVYVNRNKPPESEPSKKEPRGRNPKAGYS
jgi:hypothetical protein